MMAMMLPSQRCCGCASCVSGSQGWLQLRGLCAAQAAFRREVSETFLRCVAMGYDQDLAVIELNGLKIGGGPRLCGQCQLHSDHHPQPVPAGRAPRQRRVPEALSSNRT